MGDVVDDGQPLGPLGGLFRLLQPLVDGGDQLPGVAEDEQPHDAQRDAGQPVLDPVHAARVLDLVAGLGGHQQLLGAGQLSLQLLLLLLVLDNVQRALRVVVAAVLRHPQHCHGGGERGGLWAIVAAGHVQLEAAWQGRGRHEAGHAPVWLTEVAFLLLLLLLFRLAL